MGAGAAVRVRFLLGGVCGVCGMARWWSWCCCRALRRLRGGQHEEFRRWTGRPISIAAMSTILIQQRAHLTSPTHRSTAAPPHPPPQPPCPVNTVKMAGVSQLRKSPGP